MSRAVMSVFVCVLLYAAACRPDASSSPETTAELPTPAGVPDPEAERFAAPIERAHGLAAWRQKDALRADVVVAPEGGAIVEGEVLIKTDVSRARLERDDGSRVVWDGANARLVPPDAEFSETPYQALNQALTWSYLLTAPMRLRDPGTYLEPLGRDTLLGETYETARVTFAPGVGWAPGDWFILFRDPETSRLRGMVFAAGREGDGDENDPRAVTYDAFVEIDGVQLPTEWTLWEWSQNDGSLGSTIGSVSLDELAFVTPSDDAFEIRNSP